LKAAVDEALVMKGAEGISEGAKRAKEVGEGEGRAGLDAVEGRIVAGAIVGDGEESSETEVGGPCGDRPADSGDSDGMARDSADSDFEERVFSEGDFDAGEDANRAG